MSHPVRYKARAGADLALTAALATLDQITADHIAKARAPTAA